MKTKTIYRVNVQVRKGYWQASQAYDKFEDLISAMAPYFAQHANNITVRFFTEQVYAPESKTISQA